MKKIIFVTNYFGNGGAARVMQVLAKEFSKKNDYEVMIVSFLDDNNKYNLPEKISYVTIDSKQKKSAIENIKELRRILKQNKNSIVISFEYFVNMQTAIANFGLKNKLIISERNDPCRVGNNKKRLRNFLYRFADCLVCQTQDAKEYFPRNIQQKTVIIPNPIKEDLPEKYEGERDKEIVTFGRLEKQKNLTMLIDAFGMISKEHKEYILKIYGDGKEKQNLIEYANNKGLKDKIEFYEFQTEIHKKILRSSMYVSTSNYEGISNSMIEAMGIGLPTIVTDCPCGGARMMIENNVNGLLVPVGNTIELYKAMKKIIENPKFAELLSKNALVINERLNKNKICDMWINLIR